MSDPNPLEPLREAALVVLTPPANEIRSRGDRRRARQRVGLATALGGTLALVIGALAVTTPWSGTSPQFAGTPSHSAPTPTTSRPTTTTTATRTPAAPTPTFANLPGVELLFPSGPAGVQTSDYQGVGQGAKGICDRGHFGPYTAAVTREFDAGAGAVRSVQVFQYASSEVAGRAAASLDADASTCARRLNADSRYRDARDNSSRMVPHVTTSPSGVRVESLSYRMTMARFAGQDSGVFNETTIVHVGNRVVLAVDTSEGQDRNCEPAASEGIAQCEVPAAINTIIALATRDLRG